MKYAPFIFLMFGFFIISTPAEAYGTIEQSALRLSDTHSLYMISYEFGFTNRETDLPIVAMRDSLSNNNAVVRYDLVDETGAVQTSGSTYGLVVSDRTIVDNKYHLDEGKAGKFTLVVIAKHDSKPATKTALQITHLPLVLTENGSKKDFILAPNELITYKTPSL